MIKNYKENTLFYNSLLLFIAVVLIFMRDFGANYMEFYHINYGDIILNKLLPSSLEFKVMDVPPFRHSYHHGVIWHTFCSLIEYVLNLDGIGQKIILRHYFNFLFFSLGLCVFYFLLRELNFSKRLSTFATFALALYPRVLGHSIVNPSDIPTMTGFVFAYYTLFIYVRKKDKRSLLWHILTSAFLVGGLKPFGIFIYGATFLAIFDFNFSHKQRKIKTFMLYTTITSLLVWIIFPTLWGNPFSLFFASIANLSNYAWVTSRFHNPVWMFETLPVHFSIMFVISSFLTIWLIIREKKLLKSQKDIQILLWAFVPIIVPIIFNIAGYDGWRHHYFIFPAIIIISMRGWQIIFKNKEKVSNIAILLTITHLIYLNIYLHPHQDQYFNFITKIYSDKDIYRTKRTSITAGPYIKDALKILTTKYFKGKKLTVVINSPPAQINREILKGELTSRVAVIGARDFKRDLPLIKNQCLDNFLKLYSKENEAAHYSYDMKNELLEVWGVMNLFPRDRILECYPDEQTRNRVTHFYSKLQFTQSYARIIKLIFKNNAYYIGPYPRPDLKILEVITLDSRPVMYIQQMSRYIPINL